MIGPPRIPISSERLVQRHHFLDPHAGTTRRVGPSANALDALTAFILATLWHKTALNPGVLQQITCCRPLLRILLEHILKQVSWRTRDVVRQDQLLCSDLVVQIFVVLPTVWETATEESKQQHTRGIDISRWPTEFSLQHDLRGHIRRRATEKLDLLRVGNLRAETKINEFDVLVAVQHDVLEFNVPVRDALVVQIAECRDQLPNNSFGVVFFHTPVRLTFKESMSGTAAYVLHHKNHLRVCLDHIEELDDVWVVNSFHNLDLSANGLFPLQVLDLFFLINL